ncbi:MAG: methyl-accepting chemotaxis protein [Alphaproteobacteria bacterium]|nr:MAG: methyl-accepting chemotaxis protein [Alphaproteobacteria bacterium]
MLRLSSLSTRLIIAVVATATAAFAASFGLTIVRLDQGLERQAEQLNRLSQEKLGQRLDGEARLAGARVEGLFSSTGGRLESIAQRADVVKAISSANVVAISELLGRAAQAADIDGILVVDTKLRVFGADSDKTDIVIVNRALQESPLAQEIRAILVDNDRKRPRVLRRTIEVDEHAAQALGARGSMPLAFVVAEPIFDDFGDVFAALVAHRSLRGREATLEAFSRLDGAGVAVVAGEKSISVAGIAANAIGVSPAPDSSLLRSNDGKFWSRCEPIFERWRLCALAPVAELHALRNELVRVGEAEGRSLALWLIGAAIVSLLTFAGVMLLLSQHITRPLMQITEAVRAVARGDWKSEVTGVERVDEVGDIARAVIVLQRSLQERDRLRSDVAHAESVKKRREALEDAIRRFDRIMRSVLLSVSNSVETMDETARELARVSAVAEGEAVEAAFVSENTVSNVSSVRSATERLSAAISETVDGIRQASDVIALSNTAARSASASAEGLARTTAEIDAIMRAIAEIAAQTNALALNATVQASRAAGSGNFAAVVSDIKTLASRIGNANEDITQRLATIRGATGETVGSVRSIVQKLDIVLHQTRAIALAMERQDAVTREIAESMSAAANGSVNVSSSVERLKATIEDARGASMKVVTKATDMADEAHRLDSTVKSFLREVTA